eukprot:scaffold125604_cov31-Tisochrysis_lutea.AAC.1
MVGPEDNQTANDELPRRSPKVSAAHWSSRWVSPPIDGSVQSTAAPVSWTSSASRGVMSRLLSASSVNRTGPMVAMRSARDCELSSSSVPSRLATSASRSAEPVTMPN